MNLNALSLGDVGFVSDKEGVKNCFVVVGKIDAHPILLENNGFESVLSSVHKYAIDKSGVVVFENNAVSVSDTQLIVLNAVKMQGRSLSIMKKIVILLKSLFKPKSESVASVVSCFYNTRCHVKNVDTSLGYADFYQYCLKHFKIKTTKDVQNG